MLYLGMLSSAVHMNRKKDAQSQIVPAYITHTPDD